MREGGREGGAPGRGGGGGVVREAAGWVSESAWVGGE